MPSTAASPGLAFAFALVLTAHEAAQGAELGACGKPATRLHAIQGRRQVEPARHEPTRIGRLYALPALPADPSGMEGLRARGAATPAGRRHQIEWGPL